MTANGSSLRRRIGCVAATAALVASADIAHADESGISFWLPGQSGSLAAVPLTPGWALGVVDYYTNVSGSGTILRRPGKSRSADFLRPSMSI
jgi:hypothetical protein